MSRVYTARAGRRAASDQKVVAPCPLRGARSVHDARRELPVHDAHIEAIVRQYEQTPASAEPVPRAASPKGVTRLEARKPRGANRRSRTA